MKKNKPKFAEFVTSFTRGHLFKSQCLQWMVPMKRFIFFFLIKRSFTSQIHCPDPGTTHLLMKIKGGFPGQLSPGGLAWGILENLWGATHFKERALESKPWAACSDITTVHPAMATVSTCLPGALSALRNCTTPEPLPSWPAQFYLSLSDLYAK